jgi:hypothetical protein
MTYSAWLYPLQWQEIAATVKAANDYRCQACNKQCRRPGELNLGWEYKLTLAHTTQDYDADVVCVSPLCLPCHLKFDSPLVWVARRRQRLRQRLAGQLALAL